MTRTKEQNAEYMRRYRSKPEGDAKPVSVPEPDWTAAVDGALENRTKRQQAPRRGWRNPHADGLPDTGELIAAMTQHDRDAILRNPAIQTKRGG